MHPIDLEVVERDVQSTSIQISKYKPRISNSSSMSKMMSEKTKSDAAWIAGVREIFEKRKRVLVIKIRSDKLLSYNEKSENPLVVAWKGEGEMIEDEVSTMQKTMHIMKRNPFDEQVLADCVVVSAFLCGECTPPRARQFSIVRTVAAQI